MTTITDNTATVREMYAAFGRGDVGAILDRVTDDVDWATEAALEVAPWYGPRHGKAGVRSFFEAIGAAGPVTEFEPLTIVAGDDGDVLAVIRYTFEITATGRGGTMHLHHWWRFRDGKAYYVRASEDTALVAAACAP